MIFKEEKHLKKYKNQFFKAKENNDFLFHQMEKPTLEISLNSSITSKVDYQMSKN